MFKFIKDFIGELTMPEGMVEIHGEVLMDTWKFVIDGDLPPAETPVLTCVHGVDAPVVLELRWEICNPYIEAFFEDFLYWDDPTNEGRDYEGLVVCWTELPDMPTMEKIQ